MILRWSSVEAKVFAIFQKKWVWFDGSNVEDDNDTNNDAKHGLIENSNKIIDVCVKLILIPINNDCKIARKLFSCCC